jgi:hypothetical protein
MPTCDMESGYYLPGKRNSCFSTISTPSVEICDCLETSWKLALALTASSSGPINRKADVRPTRLLTITAAHASVVVDYTLDCSAMQSTEIGVYW